MAWGLPDPRWADLATLLALVVCEVPGAAACKTTFPGCPRGQQVRPPPDSDLGSEARGLCLELFWALATTARHLLAETWGKAETGLIGDGEVS